MQDYLWSLLTGQDGVKATRVFGFRDYVKDRWIECEAELQDEEWEFTKKHGLV